MRQTQAECLLHEQKTSRFAKVGLAAKGINLPLGDLIIGACALELGYAIGTPNVRDFSRIPDLHIVQL